MTDGPRRDDTGFFTDADQLRPLEAATGAELLALVAGLIRADLSGANPDAVVRAVEQAPAGDRPKLLTALNQAIGSDDLIAWIEAAEARRARAVQIATRLAPPDPSPGHNRAVDPCVRAFTDWGAHAYQVIIVPGYTPLDLKHPRAGVDPIARRRLEQAKRDFEEGLAPFVLVSGGNVYPLGTPYHEAIEMKKELVSMGFPADRILVEARARHSTTNLRNAARQMRAYRMTRAVITTGGGGVLGTELFDQDFYFSNPGLSTFHSRCESELGYRVGELRSAGDYHTEFVPSPDVVRINYRDALDP
jgi:DUF218 domain